MQYLLVENRQIVHLGPMEWRPRMFASELEFLEVTDVYVTQAEPNERVEYGNGIELFPVVYEIPPHDTMFQELAGPFWVYSDTQAEGDYHVIDRPVDHVKGDMFSKLANVRYNKEVSGTKIDIQNQSVSIATDRDSRNIFVQKYLLMQDTDQIQWKFPENWLSLTKEELGSLISQVSAYVQSQFDWEYAITNSISNATTIDELKLIYAEITK